MPINLCVLIILRLAFGKWRLAIFKILTDILNIAFRWQLTNFLN